MFRKLPQALAKNHRPAALAAAKHLDSQPVSAKACDEIHTMHYAELTDLFFKHEVKHAESPDKKMDDHHPTVHHW